MSSAGRYGPREGWLSVLLLAAVLWCVVHSVYEAEWADNLDLLVPLTWLLMGVGIVGAKSALRPAASHVLAVIIAVEAIVERFGSRMTASTWEGRLNELAWHVVTWFETAMSGGNSRDNVMFALLMATVGMILGYGAAWLVFAKGRGGVAVSVCASLLLLHLSYSYSTLNYHFYLLLFFGLLLLVRLELSRRQQFWQTSGLAVQGQVVRNVVMTSAGAIALVLILARQGPAEQPSELMEPVWSRFLDVWQRGQSHVDRLFGGVQGPPVVVVGLAFGNTMQPRDNFELGSGPVLKIEAPRARYWRTMSYAVYTGQGMVSGDVYGDRFEGDQPLPAPFGATEAREEITQRITVLANQSNLVFASDYPVKVDVPTLVEWRENQDDPAVVRLASMLRKGQQYTVTSSASVASEDQMRQAGEQYPKGVEKYLQLPPSVPDRVKQLAQEVTAGAPTPYDKAIALEAYLRQMSYETRVPTPPTDRDWVDYTLFDVQTGYADSLSTSMVVMLRSLDIPARVVTGFAPGTFVEDEGAFIIFESEAHAWVEVFFPRLGWINFEPSVIRDLPFRPTEQTSIILPITDGSYMGESPDMYMDDPFFDGFGDYIPPPPERNDTPWIIGLGVVLGLGLLLVAAWYAMMALLRRGLRALPWHAQWYGQFRRLAAWAGLAGRPSQTPFEYADWLDGRYPGTGKMVRPIAEVYVHGAYSGQEPGPEELARASKAWEQVRRPLARRVFLRGVIAARERFEEIRERVTKRQRAA
ncbi:MAG: transglutaminase domain-containing protein [Chloroflexi bacterium]|nr:transglutaminase domain-containing protein [Chloroflexota bacterium]